MGNGETFTPRQRRVSLHVASLAKTVLYVEDDSDDDLFFRRAMHAQDVDCQIITVPDVPTAKSYLSGKAQYNDRERFPLPSLLLTDCTIHGIYESSIDLVLWIRSHPEFAPLPILCATGNDNPALLEAFAKVGVTCHAKSSQMMEIAFAVKEALAGL